jgi:carbamoyltransferase
MAKQTDILGISAFYHDSAACLIRDGQIIAAAQEERFTRRKHDHGFPTRAIEYCLSEGQTEGSRVDHVAFYDKPFMKFGRLLETFLAYAPRGIRPFLKAMPLWMKQKLWIRDIIRQETGFEGTVLFPEHHVSHAASAFYPSPFDEAAILTVDGVGEWATASFGSGQGNRLDLNAELRFPHSLGLLYSAFTYFCGFRVNSGEYKLMGLAPYGEPVYRDLIMKELIDLKPDGSLRLNMDYFGFGSGLKMTNRRFAQLFGGPPRTPEGPLTQREMDLARSVQAVTEEVVLRMARHVHEITGQRNLCLAGGVALNCVANGRLLREGPFENLWIQPAAGDAGGALGAALAVWHDYLGRERQVAPNSDSQQGSYLGPQFDDDFVKTFLDDQKVKYESLPDDQLNATVADLIAEGKVVGWFQGRMEFGPRALGNRSILGDARSPEMQSRLNLKIKFRESFRPFAPAVTVERAEDYFELDRPSPYMLLVAPVQGKQRRDISDRNAPGLERLRQVRSDIPAVTHVDFSARIQTVDKTSNPRFHRLLTTLDQRHGCAVVANTSFNVRGEPIVCTPQDAYRCFMQTEMDFLVIGNFLIRKTEQKPLPGSAQRQFEMD